MSVNQPSRYKYLGDWLLARSEAILGGFQMGVCTNIIRTEGARDNWLSRISEEDITRILARYKEHVSFWNVRIEIIRNELQAFAEVLGRNYYEVAQKFDSLQPKRIPAEFYYTYARVRKNVAIPMQNNPNMNQLIPVAFLDEEINRIQMGIYGLVTESSINRTIVESEVDIRGRFTRKELQETLQYAQHNEIMYQGQAVQYMITYIS